MSTFIIPEFGLNRNPSLAKRLYQIFSKYYIMVGLDCKYMIIDAYFKIAGYLIGV